MFIPPDSNQIITFQDYQTGNYQLYDDRYQIAAYVLTPSRIAAAFNCPFNISKNYCAFFFINVDGIIAARSQLFGTQFYAKGKVIPAGSGSSLETAEPYRKSGVGAEVMLFFATNKEYDFFIASGISQEALPLYYKLRFYVLEFPRLMLIRNSRSILERGGLKGFALNAASRLINIPLNLLYSFGVMKGKRLIKKYEVEKVTHVPEWVDDIVLNDGHEYMELHDHRWLQWNLDYNFRGLSLDIQSFYTIKKDGIPLGFFMTKERFREKAGGKLKNILIGSIVEWGSADENILSETDIYKLSLTTFSSNLDIIETATANKRSVKEMLYCGFIPHGYAHIALKDKKKQYKDASDIRRWRIRYGYADVILT